MATQTVRISERAYHDLRALAAEFDESMQALIEQAVEEYKRRRMFEKANAVYAELRSNPEVWKKIVAERAVWEGTLADGLREEE